MDKRTLINKIEQTVAVISIPVAAVLAIWGNGNYDYSVYTEATAGLIISIGEYIKLFLPSETTVESKCVECKDSNSLKPVKVKQAKKNK